MSSRYQLVAEMKDAIWRHLARREATQQSHKVGVKYRDRHQLGSSGCFSENSRAQMGTGTRSTKLFASLRTWRTRCLWFEPKLVCGDSVATSLLTAVAPQRIQQPAGRPCPVPREHHKKQLSWRCGRQRTGLLGAGGRIFPRSSPSLPGSGGETLPLFPNSVRKRVTEPTHGKPVSPAAGPSHRGRAGLPGPPAPRRAPPAPGPAATHAERGGTGPGRAERGGGSGGCAGGPGRGSDWGCGAQTGDARLGLGMGGRGGARAGDAGLGRGAAVGMRSTGAHAPCAPRCPQAMGRGVFRQIPAHLTAQRGANTAGLCHFASYTKLRCCLLTLASQELCLPNIIFPRIWLRERKRGLCVSVWGTKARIS